MSDLLFPKHVAERLERRWAARLARDASAWRSEKPSAMMMREIVDRKGRLVPVAFKRVSLRGDGTDILVNRIL